VSTPETIEQFQGITSFSLADVEAVRLALRGGSVIDWHRLNFENRAAVDAFVRVQELRMDDSSDVARCEAVKNAAISYLRRNFEFPVPKPVAQTDFPGLLELASSRGHRQLCACTILKVMHIIHHLDARELLFMLPVADQEVFHLVEEKVYRVVGNMLASGFPILEFIGGRKNRDSLYTKLLSKRDTIAAQIFDKLRFRIVTRNRDDIWPVLRHLMQRVFPFNYVIPEQSTNTLFEFKRYCEEHESLRTHLPRLQLHADLERVQNGEENRFSAESYRVVHFVVDMPVRLPRAMLDQVPPSGWSLGPVIFVQAEFQVVDRDTEQANERGDASHSAYKHRQRESVMRRLKLGLETARMPELEALHHEAREHEEPAHPVAGEATAGQPTPKVDNTVSAEDPGDDDY
jgi:uncharacterized protein (TIGR04552 family)